jgi:catechol 2,3-dioxygenase-like lactoylglutathione lyase family enzyme
VTQRLALIALLVREYDEALAFYVGKLGFELLEDTDLGDGKRWVRVAPPGSLGSALLLARAVNDDQRAAVGRQGGGRVFLFLETDDFARDYALYRSQGVTFVRPPVKEAYGVVAVMEDLYGNPIDLIERYPLASARG